MISALGPALLAPLAVVSGTLGFVFPASVARNTIRAETRLGAYVRSRSYERAELEPSTYRVHLTRLLGGWAVLIGLAGILAPSVYLRIVVVGYTVAFLVGLGYVVVRSGSGGTESMNVR